MRLTLYIRTTGIEDFVRQCKLLADCLDTDLVTFDFSSCWIAVEKSNLLITIKSC